MKSHPISQNIKEKAKIKPAFKPSRARIWAFRFITVICIPACLWGLLEWGLRLGGYGYSTRAIVKHNLDNRVVYGHNYQFAWQFFPPSMARNFDGFVFDRVKPAGTYRIFILGESAAMGMPAPAYNFGRILKEMLKDKYPDIHFEVHTAAMVAINSHAVLKIAADCARYEPDLFIVYMGNNEVVGPFGPGTVFSPLLPNLSLIRANLAVKSTRSGQLLEHLLHSVKSDNQTPHRWGGLEMFLDKQVRHDSPEMDYVYNHFETNLRDICSIAHRSGARVIVSTVGVNLKDSPPFASSHRSGLSDAEKQSWQTLYQEGIGHEAAGEPEQAISCYQRAAQIDATFADLQYRLGRNFQRAGDSKTAKDYYLNACQYDTLRFRADARINEIIRSAATQRENEGLYFLDGAAALEAQSPDQIPGEDLFYEHVHFNFKGNYVMAVALLPVVQKCIPVHSAQSNSALLTEQQAAERLAYTDFERHDFLNRIYLKMLSEPPFTNQLYHDERMKAADSQIRDIEARLGAQGPDVCRRHYETAIQNNPDDWQILWHYACFLGNLAKDILAQEHLLRKVIRLCPYDGAYLSLGKNLYKQGKLNEAQDILESLLKLKPNAGQAHIVLASIHRHLQHSEPYIQHLSAGIAMDPASSIEPYGALAEAYDKAGKPDKAIQILYKAVAIFPEEQTAAAHATLGYLLNAQGRYEKALEEMKIALRIKPDFAGDELFKSLLAHLETKVNR